MAYVPDLLFIEMTRACEYSCAHCRADSIALPEDGEIELNEMERAIDEVMKVNEKCVVILTGGDPLLSPSSPFLIKYLNSRRIRFSVSPPASPILNFEYLDYLKESGVNSISMSIDGSPSTHDAIRMKKGSFKDTLDIIGMARDIGISVQVNSTVMKKNINDFPVILKTLNEIGVRVWEVFFLINVGRGISEKSISRDEFEDFLKFLYGVEANFNINIRTVEAPEYRRIKASLTAEERISGGRCFNDLSAGARELTGIDITRKMKEPGNGRRMKTLFISSRGEVMVSGLFPLSLGNIKEKSVRDILNNEALVEISDSRKFSGKCSICEYFELCGGSRARAYAETGDYLESDPLCTYVPIVGR
ncbi:MAG: radical SAM protein [Candidatus Thermoplasmatota archaeon]|jgi:radical SAM protein with 4Fe4S-binding SPASM domain|nr:radical SAM protein [Candidatus Thermoplasmatota archaeon]